MQYTLRETEKLVQQRQLISIDKVVNPCELRKTVFYTIVNKAWEMMRACTFKRKERNKKMCSLSRGKMMIDAKSGYQTTLIWSLPTGHSIWFTYSVANKKRHDERIHRQFTFPLQHFLPIIVNGNKFIFLLTSSSNILSATTEFFRWTNFFSSLQTAKHFSEGEPKATWGSFWIWGLLLCDFSKAHLQERYQVQFVWLAGRSEDRYKRLSSFCW